MKQRILIEQLKSLPNEKLFQIANLVHVSTEDVDTDPKSIENFCRFLKSQLSIGGLIQVIEDNTEQFPNAIITDYHGKRTYCIKISWRLKNNYVAEVYTGDFDNYCDALWETLLQTLDYIGK